MNAEQLLYATKRDMTDAMRFWPSEVVTSYLTQTATTVGSTAFPHIKP
jgi:hypothetical protein